MRPALAGSDNKIVAWTRRDAAQGATRGYGGRLDRSHRCLGVTCRGRRNAGRAGATAGGADGRVAAQRLALPLAGRAAQQNPQAGPHALQARRRAALAAEALGRSAGSMWLIPLMVETLATPRRARPNIRGEQDMLQYPRRRGTPIRPYDAVPGGQAAAPDTTLRPCHVARSLRERLSKQWLELVCCNGQAQRCC